jgi:hypothetical protein
MQQIKRLAGTVLCRQHKAWSVSRIMCLIPLWGRASSIDMNLTGSRTPMVAIRHKRVSSNKRLVPAERLTEHPCDCEDQGNRPTGYKLPHASTLKLCVQRVYRDL